MREALEDCLSDVRRRAYPGLPPPQTRSAASHLAALKRIRQIPGREEAGFERAKDTAGLVRRLSVPEPLKLPG